MENNEKINIQNIEDRIIENLKKSFLGKDFQSIFIKNLISVLIIILLISTAIWYFRAEVFSYFANEYLENEQNKEEPKEEENALSENIIEKTNIFTQESFVIDAVKKTNPAVVAIVISKQVPKYEAYYDNTNPFGDLFQGFNFAIPQYKQNGTEKKEVGGGSGFLVSADGLIVTNKHVVSDQNAEYTVFMNDGKKYTATVVARDSVLDIALIRISGNSFPYLSLGNSDKLEVGQSVIAIGNALAEYRNTVSVGVVSGLARSVIAGDGTGKSELLDKVIQTDAAINPGNSGGPLLNLHGQVIGVNVAIVSGSQNIGFALPINSVKSAIESVKNTGKIVRPYVGIRYLQITETLKNKNDLPVDYGILVQKGDSKDELAVVPGSPADKAGIVENDIILSIDGIKLDIDTSFASIIRQKKVGQSITLRVLSRGIEKNVSLVLEAYKE